MRRLALTLTCALTLCGAALAADVPYLDDRSTPEAVIKSFYSTIDRAEYSRAYGYYEDGEGVGGYDAFAAGYADTKSVLVKTGQAAEEGAAGSTYYTLPVVIDAENKAGKHAFFAGCYTLRLVSPQLQEPPFRPMHIVEGKLKKVKGSALSFAPADCNP